MPTLRLIPFPKFFRLSCLIALSLVVSCSDQTSTPEKLEMDQQVKMNHIQVVGSHNSYKPGIRPEVLDLIREEDPDQAQALDYGHPSLEEQLDLGVRKIELDVFADLKGGLFSSPAGLVEVAKRTPDADLDFDPNGDLENPGFKVFHIQDLDFESHCLLLSSCLSELKNWSDSHPGHLPIIMTFNAKDLALNDENMTVPETFDESTFRSLDQAFIDGLGRPKLITPDDIRMEGLSLRESILERGWPSLEESRGKFLLVLDEVGEKRERYIDGKMSLEGREMFVNSDEGLDSAAFFIINEPIIDAAKISRLVREGYIIRTRADAGTIEARNADTTRRDKSFDIGAHIVTTDYYFVDPKIGTDYIVEVPDGYDVARCNPITAPDICNSKLLE